MILSLAKFQGSEFRQLTNRQRWKSGMGVNSGADGGSAQRQFAQAVTQLFQAPNREFDLPGVTAKLLTKPDGSCILQMRSSDLDDPIEGLGFLSQRCMQSAE